MKISESYLRQIISEELSQISEEEQLRSDVEVIKKMLGKLLPRIDTDVEYGQLLKILLNHPVKNKARIHRQLRDLFMAGMKEQ